jgi:two-component system sensor histidine kinase PilS (NtrC family)
VRELGLGEEEDPQERPSLDPGREQLVRLMGARLLLALLVLGVALTLVGVREGSEAEERGLYGTMAAAFLASLVYVVVVPRVRRLARFGALQIATDIALLTSIVYFSGGKDSIFTFLHVLLIVYAARLFGRSGAYLTTAVASLAYGGVLLGIEQGLLPRLGDGPTSPTPWFTLWGLHSGAWLLVALLSSTLSRELHWAGRELDRRRTALERLQRHHERTVESLTSGLLTASRAGRVTSLNQEGERITGITPGHALGLDLEEVLPGVRRCVIDASGSSPGRMRARMEFTHPGGERLHLGVAASVLRDVGGEPSGHVVIFQDVSDVVRMEAELRRSERLAAVGELSAGMAHEVRNPLAAISGSIQMLRAGLGAGEEDAERRRLMDIVVRETDRVDALITEFLRFARPAQPKLVPVELASLVADVLEVFAGETPERVTLECDVPGGIQAHADGDHLRQLLWNLLLNGVQAISGAGRLRVSARAVGAPQEQAWEGRNATQAANRRWVEVCVADSGGGIPPEVLERIFEPFFTTRRSGSGLGLATVHRIVEAHGGSLGVKSAPGEGTEVRILLPRSEEAS